MGLPAEILEDELFEAIEKKDKKAVKHFVRIIVENIETREEKKESDTKFEKLLLTIQEGFKSVDKRFEEVNRRFEDMQKYMDKRFEDINKRFEMMFKFITIGFSLITILIVTFKFIK